MDKKVYLTWPDVLVTAGYFVFILIVGCIASRKSRGDSMDGYFLASRNMHWILVGASLFASCVGSSHFIGLAGSGAATGIVVSTFEINAGLVLLVLGWFFAPVYLSSGVYTMPEYLRERFGGQRIRVYFAVLSLLLNVFTKISTDLYGGALFIQEATGQTSPEWLYISVIILLVVSALFTIAGGLTAVIWTDLVQAIVMVIGAFIVAGVALSEVGGYQRMTTDYFYATPDNVSEQYEDCAKPSPFAMNIFRPITPGVADLPWTGVVFGMIISAVWFWCTDQVMVQRVLASKNLTHAKAGCVLGGWLKFLPLFLMVFPGMCARILYPDSVACADPDECYAHCGSRMGCSNVAYIKLVLRLLPVGMRGLMLAVMMAALMSSLTSIFNSSSTIFTIDIWERIRRRSWKEMDRQAIEIEKLIIGRASVAILVIISVIWIPFIQNASSQLFIYNETISAFLAPPICAVYVLAIFWARTNEQGAFWGLMVGLLVGVIRFAMEFSYVVPPCGSDLPDPRPEIIKLLVGNVHFLHFGCILFVITLIVSISVSYMTEPIPEKCLYRLTFWTRKSDKPRTSIREWRNETDENVLKKMEAETSQNGVPKDAPKDSALWTLVQKSCGFVPSENQASGTNLPGKSPEEFAKEAAEFMKEEKWAARYVNCSAIVIAVFTVFIYGFYA